MPREPTASRRRVPEGSSPPLAAGQSPAASPHSHLSLRSRGTPKGVAGGGEGPVPAPARPCQQASSRPLRPLQPYSRYSRYRRPEVTVRALPPPADYNSQRAPRRPADASPTTRPDTARDPPTCSRETRGGRRSVLARAPGPEAPRRRARGRSGRGRGRDSSGVGGAARGHASAT